MNPETKPKSTAKDFFLQFGVIVSLYASAISLTTIIFQAINYSFPDNVNVYYEPYSEMIRMAVSFVIVAFPLFIFLSYLVSRGETLDPSKKEISVRKWLSYLTIFVAGAVVAGDLITLIRYFLSGEITTRFILKVLALVIVAGIIFGYYLSSVLRKEGSLKGKLFAWSSSALVVLSVVVAFLVMGSPAKARQIRFDGQRISSLSEIQYQIVNYWQRKERLPQSLGELEDSISGFKVPVDPDTSNSYEYLIKGERKFELCANFSLPSEKGKAFYYINLSSQDNWEHSSGRVCFERTIDPELYPQLNKQF